MLTNYFKLAIKVLGRQRFFTFISLFGISFTLTILMLIASFLDTELGNNKPFSDKDKMVFANRIAMKYEAVDTIMQLDSQEVGNKMTYDTSYSYENNIESTSTSSFSYTFLDKYMREVKSAENYTFYSPFHSFDVFLNSNKLSLNTFYCDENFWKVLDFELTEGRFFEASAVKNQQQVLLTTTETAKSYFGQSSGVVGKTMTLDGKNYEVVGVLKKASNSGGVVQADIYLPFTCANPRMLSNEDYMGQFNAIYKGKNQKAVSQIMAEIEAKGKLIPLPNPDEYNILEIFPMSFQEMYAFNLYYNEDPKKSLRVVLIVLSGLLLLFILLPTLNLININISRILERSAEIGVRKAFGANARQILFQFVFENIILTFLGGAIGFGLALLLLNVINESQVFPDVILGFNYKVFIYSLLITLGFGIISGIIPAFRMSKVHIVQALKQNQL